MSRSVERSAAGPTPLGENRRALARYAPAVVVGAVVLALSFVTRVGVIAVHGGWPTNRWAEVARAFLSGAVYDVLVTLWLLLPLVLYLTIASARWLGRRVNRALLFGT